MEQQATKQESKDYENAFAEHLQEADPVQGELEGYILNPIHIRRKWQ